MKQEKLVNNQEIRQEKKWYSVIARAVIGFIAGQNRGYRFTREKKAETIIPKKN